MSSDTSGGGKRPRGWRVILMRWLSLNAQPLENRLPPNSACLEVYWGVRCSRERCSRLPPIRWNSQSSTPSWASWDHRTAYISRDVSANKQDTDWVWPGFPCVVCSHPELGNSSSPPESQPHLFTGHRSRRSLLNTQSPSPCFRVFHRQNIPSSFVSLPVRHRAHLGHSNFHCRAMWRPTTLSCQQDIVLKGEPVRFPTYDSFTCIYLWTRW